MTGFKIWFPDHKKKERVVMCRGNCDADFFGFMQYAIDSMYHPEILILENEENGVTYDAYRLATERYGMRKRTPEERLNNVKTYKL